MDFETGMTVVVIGFPALLLIIRFLGGGDPYKSPFDSPVVRRIPSRRRAREDISPDLISATERDRKLREWFDSLSARPLFWFKEK